MRHPPSIKAEPAIDTARYPVMPHPMLPRRRRPTRRRILTDLGRLVLPPDPTTAAAEPAGEAESVEGLVPDTVALRARYWISHRRPVPAQDLHGTHSDCFGELPLRSIHSPPAPIQVPQTGFCFSSLLML